MRFSDIVPSADLLAGVKAVWGRTSVAVIGFSNNGNARSAADRGLRQPFAVTIGGGAYVPPELRGRAVDLIRLTGAYGPTDAFVPDPEDRARLEQWPVSVALREVYEIVGWPRLVEDLNLENRQILTLSFDRVSRMTDRVEELWDRLSNRRVERLDQVVLPGFVDPGKLVQVGSRMPRISIASKEGQTRWRLAREAERNTALGAELRARHRILNGGRLVCEACGFDDELDGMFDAHHKLPIFAGERITTLADLSLLCPTCHRWAHKKTTDRLYPVSLSELRKIRPGAMKP